MSGQGSLHLRDDKYNANVSLFSPRLADVGQVALIRECLQKVAQSDPGLFLNYPTRDAYKPMRQAVVDWLSDLPLGPLSHDDIVLTHGGQNGLCLVFQTISARCQAGRSGRRPVLRRFPPGRRIDARRS